MAWVAACARQGAPPGGPQDRRPPVVIRTTPDTFATLTEPFRGPVVFEFDERISERPGSGSLDDAVLVSPATGNVRVEKGRRSLEVTVGGGYRPGQVYRITLLPVIRDLFGNQLQDPLELVFSTGPAITASAVAGLVWDRATGASLEEYLVTATSEDSTVYLARTDTGGIYALRYLVPGTYVLTAFQDRNRNERADSAEIQGTLTETIAGADTLFADVPVLRPDTSPARLLSVAVLDSTTLTLTFDDYLDPLWPASRVAVTVTQDGAGPGVPGVDRVFNEPEYDAWVAEQRAALAEQDSIQRAAAERARELARRDTARRAGADTLPTPPPDSAGAIDTLTARAPTIRAPRRPPSPAGPPELPRLADVRAGMAEDGQGLVTGPDGRPLPGRRLVVILKRSLTPDSAFHVTAAGATNLNGVPDGGGEAEGKAPPPPEPARDTTFVPDTVPPPDTLPPPDTIPPDTGRVVLPGRHR